MESFHVKINAAKWKRDHKKKTKKKPKKKKQDDYFEEDGECT